MPSSHPDDRGSFDAEVVDAKGNRYLQISGYRTAAIPSAVDAERLKALQAAMSLGIRRGMKHITELS